LNFRLAAGDRAVFIGLPRSGKTNLIAALLQGVRSFVVIDSKRHPDEWAAWAKTQGILVTSDPKEINRREGDNGSGTLANPRIIIQITSRALRDRGGWTHPGATGHTWTEILEAIVARGRRYSTLVVFDEVIQTLPSGSSHPLAWEIYEQGRAFGVSCWAGSQIANRMDTLVIRLAEHCFAFWMGNRKEQQLLAEARGLDCSVLSSLEQHHFAYQQVGPRSEWTICQPVPLVLKADSGKKRLSSRHETRHQDEGSQLPEQDRQPVT
jgi:hypothetical protein